MTPARIVEVHSQALGRLPVGAIVILPGGEVLRVREDGGTDELLPGGHPRPGHAHATSRGAA